MNTALLWQKEASDESPKSEKVLYFCFYRLDLAYITSNLSFEQKHPPCWKIFRSRHDIALMSMYMTDICCSFARNVIFKSCFLLSEWGRICKWMSWWCLSHTTLHNILKYEICEIFKFALTYENMFLISQYIWVIVILNLIECGLTLIRLMELYIIYHHISLFMEMHFLNILFT